MLIWPTFTTLALGLLAIPAPAKAEPIACALQLGARWFDGDDEVSAIACRRIPGVERLGFFVPSLKYRALDRAARAGDLADRALVLAKLELDERNAVAFSLERDLQTERTIANGWEAEAKKAVDDLEFAAKAAERRWYESPIAWFSAGVAVAGAIFTLAVVATR